jgi:Endonuclease-reverse transcriptase
MPCGMPDTGCGRKKAGQSENRNAAVIIDMNPNKDFTIIQYNLNKSRLTTDSLLNDPDSQNLTILALREQYHAPGLNSLLIHHSWTLIELLIRSETPPRSAIYINKLLPSSSFKQVKIPFSDRTVIAITTNERKSTLIVNVYNPGDHEIITPLRQHLQKHLHTQDYDKVLILSDFNLHHPLWSPQPYTRYDQLSEELLQGCTTSVQSRSGPVQCVGPTGG